MIVRYFPRDWITRTLRRVSDRTVVFAPFFGGQRWRYDVACDFTYSCKEIVDIVRLGVHRGKLLCRRRFIMVGGFHNCGDFTIAVNASI